jgi:hypothetical protein
MTVDFGEIYTPTRINMFVISISSGKCSSSRTYKIDIGGGNLIGSKGTTFHTKKKLKSLYKFELSQKVTPNTNNVKTILEFQSLKKNFPLDKSKK